MSKSIAVTYILLQNEPMGPLMIIASILTFTGAGYLIAVGISRLIAEQVSAEINRGKHK